MANNTRAKEWLDKQTYCANSLRCDLLIFGAPEYEITAQFEYLGPDIVLCFKLPDGSTTKIAIKEAYKLSNFLTLLLTEIANANLD